MAIFLVYLVMPVVGFLAGIGVVQLWYVDASEPTLANIAKVVASSFGILAASGLLAWIFFAFAESVPEAIGWALIAGFALALALAGAGISILIFGLLRLA